MNATQLAEVFPDASRDVLVVAEQPIRDPDGGVTTRGVLYARMRRRGEGERFASMCATQRAPRCMTDDVFWAGRPHFSEVYGETYAKEVEQILASRGTTLGAHADYFPELAEHKGDPKAVVSRAQGRSYIKRRCEEMGVSCSGAVTAKASEPREDPLAPENCVALADDLIADHAEEFLKTEPGAERLSQRELKEAITDKHGSH